MAAKTQGGIRLSALCPKFLHTNSTSHTWPFSAVAELIDNAYDPDVSAKQIWIDKTVINDNICLTFTDNGNGMNSEKLHKMLSFGFSEKSVMNGRVPVGLYGNGFKSGSMRLGKDAIVFTKNGETMNVGLLSQTFLEATKAEHVMVPIVTFNNQHILLDPFGSKNNLKAILTHSLFSTEEKLLAELDAIMGKRGTRIIIWNLRRDKNEKTEFDFDKDKYDIRIPEDLDETGKRGYKKQERMDQVVPESDYSLRAYCSILYLKPRMQIILRGQKVRTQLVSKSLAFIDFFLNANNMGVGVVGIIECNFLKPTHNKQDFDYTNEYRLTIAALGEKLNDYWNEMKTKKNEEYPLALPVEEIQKQPDQTWVQCDGCLKWRKLPDGIEHLPDKWYCSLNPDPQFRNCNVPEEPEDDDVIHPTYEKTYKKKDREKLKRRLEYSHQLCNEMFLKTPVSSSKDFKTFSAVSGKEAVPRSVLPETSNASIKRPLFISNRSVSSTESDSSLKRRSQDCSASVTSKTPRLTDKTFNSHTDDDDDDEDVIILEESSTPKPSADSDVPVIKTECINLDREGKQEEESSGGEPCSATTSESKSEQSTSATQTELPKVVVKKEEAEDDVAIPVPRSEMETKLQNVQDAAEAPADVENALSELKNQLNLVKEEKETYQNKCEVLTSRVESLEQTILEMNNKYVKKEMCHQSTETISPFVEENVHERSLGDVTVLYEQALEEIAKLKEQCSTLQTLKTECTNCAEGENKNEVDEIAVQLDDVFRQLDKCSIERDRYKSEVELLEVEKNQLACQCEELKAEVAQLKASIPQAVAHANDSTTSNVEDSVNFSDGESLKLRSLRVNVGQLLTTIMPDLDLQQVNYDIDVVDEILGQVVEQMHEISST
uniref:MORC family CW-type zinc finger 3 n=1 Tax=Nothoprocta perdicaria TaxID=30464 RepID=A0A8C6ZNF2_NOTPE